MRPSCILESLLDLGQRFYRLYLRLSDQRAFPPELCFLWNCFAEDMRCHLSLLRRSADFLDLLEILPQVTQETVVRLEKKIRRAEEEVRQTRLSINAALQLTLMLESSELSQLEESWFHGFRPALHALFQVLLPDKEWRLRAIRKAIYSFGTDSELQMQITTVWMASQRQPA